MISWPRMRGTFWYHPHQRSYEQVGRGLYGPVIVEEREPNRADPVCLRVLRGPESQTDSPERRVTADALLVSE